MQPSDLPWAFVTLRRTLASDPLPPVVLLAKEDKDPFVVLTAALLSARTRDATTHRVAKRLLNEAPTPQMLLKMTLEELTDSIRPVGFFRQKARHLLLMAERLVNEYDGSVPSDFKALTALPGVGPKTANLVLGQAFSIPAICVDTHVHRITNRWGLVSTTSPEKTEAALRKIVPPRYWIDLNPLLVQFGQKTCLPRKPQCPECPLRQRCRHGRDRWPERPTKPIFSASKRRT